MIEPSWRTLFPGIPCTTTSSIEEQIEPGNFVPQPWEYPLKAGIALLLSM